jgi:hypothetical protein
MIKRREFITLLSGHLETRLNAPTHRQERRRGTWFHSEADGWIGESGTELASCVVTRC